MARFTVEQLVEGVKRGDRLSVGRALTLVENGDPQSWELLRELSPLIGVALRVGITGPPGAGKSTLADALVLELRTRGHKLGVIAVDPSSPFSGGALLGDRVRMLKSTEDPEVFMRSMASRGCLGGLARTTQEAADVLDAAGKDVVILETVGVGQSELTVASACDLTVVVLVPESGGMVQAMKAGLMEIADLFVVNKSDRPGADEMKMQLVDASRYVIWEGRRPAVVMTSATKGDGVVELADEVEAYGRWLQEGGRKEKKRRNQAKTRIRELVSSGLEERFWARDSIQRALDHAAQEHQQGGGSLVELAQQFWASVRDELSRSEIVT
jgi:LAO/AO transport system kinase